MSMSNKRQSDPNMKGNDEQRPHYAPIEAPRPSGVLPVLTRNSTVAALVPHYRCEEWLADCLESLVTQTRPLQSIVVIDDNSTPPPVEIVRRFPQVTLYASQEKKNVGPYRLVQEVINNTNYDAYLFQDADDWSAEDRLELLLDEAERTGAELIGSQEVRILCDEGEVVPFSYPLDANASLVEQPVGFPLLHPTSLVSRDLVLRIGGFATGLRFGGDSEFLRRAGHAARVVNIPHYSYFRRIRGGSLTMAADTGFQSTERQRLMVALHERAKDNAALVAKGKVPNLAPHAIAPAVKLKLIAGPGLRHTSPQGTVPWPLQLLARTRRFLAVMTNKDH